MEKLFRVLYLFAAISTVACMWDDSYNSPSPAPILQPTTPSPTPSCSDVIYNMVDCISFLADGGSDDQPSDSCCSGFKSVLNVDGECICEAIQSSSQLGIELNMTRAAMLSPACGVDSFSISSCETEAPSPAPTTPIAPTPTQPLEPPTTPSPPSTPATEPPSPSSSITPPAEAPMSGSSSVSASIFIVFIIFGLYASLV